MSVPVADITAVIGPVSIFASLYWGASFVASRRHAVKAMAISKSATKARRNGLNPGDDFMLKVDEMRWF
ncbi:hypothetical protein [Rhodoferax sp.]|uniref:hypothetical protein n=1 Tax=Rhodoferax sp. TaxID=50421 RepID=UPI003BB5769C